MTKTLTFKNNELLPTANFLNDLNLKNRASRGRTKLIKLIAAKNSEYVDERKEALDPYFKDGELLKGPDDKVDETNAAKANEVASEIEAEPAVIEFTEYSDKLKALYESIVDYPDDLNDQDALLYDILMDQFEAVFENEKDGEK
ncbi:DUF1617 family protein [Latilactobacillus sp. 5-91]|uniref:DUF1617 family protein n=1 Tax=Latilactobacillus sp. 5-91 TaxID=3410924 RepID=UPI003C75685D